MLPGPWLTPQTERKAKMASESDNFNSKPTVRSDQSVTIL